MELTEYQAKAMGTCMPSCKNISYMLLNLVGEVGEFASKVAKSIRAGHGNIERNDLMLQREIHKETRTALKAEAGDILWQISGLCTIMGWSLDDIAQSNLDKLASRRQRGVIDGNGDNR